MNLNNTPSLGKLTDDDLPTRHIGPPGDRYPKSERHYALDFADTWPRDEFLYGCTGDCAQGRRDCQTPDACRLPERDANDDSEFGAIAGLLSWPGLVSLGIVAAIVCVVVFR